MRLSFGEHDLDEILRPERPRLGEQTYTELRQLIVDGRIPPGTRLVEQTLTKALKVSRTPLREALFRLEQDGVIVRGDGGTLYVTKPTAVDLEELLGMRAVLEGYCARFAATRITDRELAELEAAQSLAVEAEAAEDLTELAQMSTRFHSLINKASRTARCAAIVDDLQDWAVRYRPQALTSEANRRLSIEQHAGIFEALRAHDAERAEKLVRDHLNDVAEMISDGAATADSA